MGTGSAISSDCKNWSSFPRHGQKLIPLESRPVRPLLLGKMRTRRSVNKCAKRKLGFLQQILTLSRGSFHVPIRNVNHCLTPSSVTHR